MEKEFNYLVDQFADLQVLRYEVPGFEELSLKQKLLLYHLSEAALMGRDILYDQNCRYNLRIRRTLEAIYIHYDGDRSCADFQALEVYLKRVWFANGIHHHYAEDKFIPAFSADYFKQLLSSVSPEYLPLVDDETPETLFGKLYPIMFDKNVMPKRTVQSGDVDWVQSSANNYYGGGISQTEVESFYGKMKIDSPSDVPVSFGLNSRLVKENGIIKEKVWKVGGLYTKAIEPIVAELEKAAKYAENERQKDIIETLVSYYKSGDLKTFDAYSILWVEDTASEVDFVNGFIETYGDPLGLKASWESVVDFQNHPATERTKVISSNAQWFEDHSPVDNRFKKKKVKGVSAKVITVAMLGGDCYPSTPIGINLPNADWIRKDYGSKSVTIENIMQAYDKAAQGSGFSEEFVWSGAERDLIKKYGFVTDILHTDLHECLGHGSGQLLAGVDSDSLKAYASTLEEARADLFGLYYLADPKMKELGLVPDAEAFKAGYYKYMMNGLMTQLVRIELGKNVEEAHMRNRQLIAKWVYEQGKTEHVVEWRKKNGNNYVVINDYLRLRELFGQLLAEVQRIKSEGDYEAGRQLVETYGVRIDLELHKEVKERYEKLHLSPYKGFVNPVMRLMKDASETIVDVKLDYTESYTEQMLRYSKEYSYLPVIND